MSIFDDLNLHIISHCLDFIIVKLHPAGSNSNKS